MDSRKFRRRVETLAVEGIASLNRGWQLSVRVPNRSRQTIKGYMKTLDLFRDSPIASGTWPLDATRLVVHTDFSVVVDQLVDGQR